MFRMLELIPSPLRCWPDLANATLGAAWGAGSFEGTMPRSFFMRGRETIAFVACASIRKSRSP